MDVKIGPRTEMTEDRSDQGPKWMHTICIHKKIKAKTTNIISKITLT